MENVQRTINLILKAIAVAMPVAVIVLGILGVVEVGAQVNLLGIGLFALSLWALQTETQKDRPNQTKVKSGETP
jgi:hypothetical protein